MRPGPRGSQLHGHAMRRVPATEGHAYMRHVGAELRRARTSVDIAAAELAAALDVHPRTVHGWESGRVRPTLANLYRCAIALGMRVEALLPEMHR